MDTLFDPSQYRDEYQARLRELIEAKIAGREIVAPREEGPGKVIDLMEALRASVEKAQKEKDKEREKDLVTA